MSLSFPLCSLTIADGPQSLSRSDLAKGGEKVLLAFEGCLKPRVLPGPCVSPDPLDSPVFPPGPAQAAFLLSTPQLPAPSRGPGQIHLSLAQGSGLPFFPLTL